MSVDAQVLDIVYGRPAAGVRTRLERKVPLDREVRAVAGQDADVWEVVAQAVTDADGCVRDWKTDRLDQDAYRIVFHTYPYFASLGQSVAYAEIAVSFRLRDEADSCQVQVMLGPYSYSMYFDTRG